ncbi:MgtC/SapB family protein [Paludisphaera sp.]|uniref:MgtC/SapB family protein n=1 Tax=Paludisphaera sp. TaxID=2017432 RepID=UPI00301BDE79
MTTADLAIRLTTAATLGGLVGLERHRADKAAGLRTHMLVSLGASLFMIVSAHGFDDSLRPGTVDLDPSRVAAQVVSGIGFLGAGAIVRRKDVVVGLTTAASVWAVAAVGLAAGGGLYAAAAASTALILLTLTAVRKVEDAFAVRAVAPRTLSMVVVDGQAAERLIGDELTRRGLALPAVRFSAGDVPGTRRIDATVTGVSDADLLALAARLQADEGILEVSYEASRT